MLLERIEFYNSPCGAVHVKPEDSPMYILDESHTDLIQSLLSEINEMYPDAFERLSAIYSASSLNKTYFEFRMAHRFCRCNFGLYDTMSWDIDEFCTWHFEQVPCPMRGQCPDEGVICHPKLKTKLSERELEIAKLLCTITADEICDELHLSIRTVYNHIRAIKIRLKLKTTAQITSWYESIQK